MAKEQEKQCCGSHPSDDHWKISREGGERAEEKQCCGWTVVHISPMTTGRYREKVAKEQRRSNAVDSGSHPSNDHWKISREGGERAEEKQCCGQWFTSLQ